MRKTPNPASNILATAVVGGAGLAIPPMLNTPPKGMAAIVLYVPVEHIAGKTVIDIQRDIGLPWHVEGGPGMWFDGQQK